MDDFEGRVAAITGVAHGMGPWFVKTSLTRRSSDERAVSACEGAPSSPRRSCRHCVATASACCRSTTSTS